MKTRNLILTAIFGSLVTVSLTAQNMVSVKGGAALSTQTNRDGTFRFDVAAGLGYEFALKGRLWMHPEINYIPKGTAIGVFENVTQYRTKITYFELPVLFKYKYVYNNSFDWALVGGPSIGYASKAENVFFALGRPSSQEIPIDKSTGINPIDIGINLGIEANFAVDYGQVTLYSRFQHGWSRVAANPEGFPVRNIVWESGLMFKFGRQREIEIYEEDNVVKGRAKVTERKKSENSNSRKPARKKRKRG